MKLSEQTLNVLKNFSTINSGLVIQAGNVQRTMSPARSVLVETVLDDEFPCQLGIYDLNQFLGTVTTLNDPNLEFVKVGEMMAIMMTDDTMIMRYSSCSTELIISPPNKDLLLVEPEVKFDLSEAVVTKLLRMASMNNFPHLSFIAKNNVLSLMVHDKTNEFSDYASIKISDHSGPDMMATFKTENIKIIPDDYHVEVKLGTFSTFTSKTKKNKYFIVVEAK